MSSKRDEFKDMLGMLPDAEVAEAAGVAVSTVRGWRAHFEIAPFDGDTDTDTETDTDASSDDGDGDGEAADEPGAEKAEPKPTSKKRAKPAAKPAPPSCVRATGRKIMRGPNGRTMRVGLRDIYRNDLAAWLWENHRDLVEIYPPPVAEE